MPTFSVRQCELCSATYTPTGPAARFCPSCSLQRKRERDRQGTARYRKKYGLIKNPGVGKGGANQRGPEDTQFKTGIAYFMKSRRRIKEERRYCERCGKDLIDATRYEWVIHHRDHDRTNNVDENFELLCKRCHQLEHECQLAFSARATTIPEGSRD